MRAKPTLENIWFSEYKFRTLIFINLLLAIYRWINENEIFKTHDASLRPSIAVFENTCTWRNQSQSRAPSSLALSIKLVEILLVVDVTWIRNKRDFPFSQISKENALGTKYTQTLRFSRVLFFDRIFVKSNFPKTLTYCDQSLRLKLARLKKECISNKVQERLAWIGHWNRR